MPNTKALPNNYTTSLNATRLGERMKKRMANCLTAWTLTI